ncbi:MAG TPA: phosphatase PAP2 family protein, partial [Candidatus Limnocylindria bacterium]|nr:phosphatase PAP2 family protein [Candidatus Limnocylindria bacterium]
ERGARRFVPDGGTSFPSGHASVIFELATIASHHARSRPVSILAYTLATTVALQRVEARTHWPSDVFIAAATGHIIAKTITRRHDERRENAATSSLRLETGGSDVRLVYRF